MRKQRLANILFKKTTHYNKDRELLLKRALVCSGNRRQSLLEEYICSNPRCLQRDERISIIKKFNNLKPYAEEIIFRFGKLGAIIKNVECEGREFGDIFLEIGNHNKTAIVDEEYHSRLGQPHPHIGKGNTICFGDAETAAIKAISQQDWGSYIDIAETVLRNYYEPGAYQVLSSWDEPECDICGDFVSEIVCECGVRACRYHQWECSCGAIKCADCGAKCKSCRCRKCEECATHLDCGCYYCNDCIKTCDNCGLEICKDCTTSCDRCGHEHIMIGKILKEI